MVVGEAVCVYPLVQDFPRPLYGSNPQFYQEISVGLGYVVNNAVIPAGAVVAGGAGERS